MLLARQSSLTVHLSIGARDCLYRYGVRQRPGGDATAADQPRDGRRRSSADRSGPAVSAPGARDGRGGRHGGRRVRDAGGRRTPRRPRVPVRRARRRGAPAEGHARTARRRTGRHIRTTLHDRI